ncbi:uncharacterized protein A4U43_C04F2820 [Asparagus officinalis]|uniref:Uncharacterized protein n=1 Tax=Asparagus officinalis TaxID=4686 RepID=A0A5P1EYG9_ASPOF|nr:uncharacterized protein A4U43_C04F2820 [Asparagus officinalis]
MEGETKRTDLRSFLESIRSSEVLEDRVSLITQIGNCCQVDPSDLALLIEWLVTFWKESTCLSLSNCMLNKAVLCAAAKYLESDISNYISQFLILGTKANVWCIKHLQVIIMSIEEARDEEHSNLFCQLIMDALSFSLAIISILTRSPMLGEKVLMLSIETFISELLNLTKSLIFEVKKIHLITSEVLKVAQVVLDAAVKLCRAYFQTVRQDFMEMSINSGERSEEDGHVDYARHIVAITATTIECLYELGIFAASGGGNLVSVLNISWKGVVFLLQLDKGALAERVNISDIILTLISLATETLQCAAETWSSATEKETPIVSEAKRTFLPIKFYLINAVRISSEYSFLAIDIYQEISRCVLLISSVGISLSRKTHLRAVSEALIEFLEPTSFLLLHTLLNSADVKFESKIQILDWLFSYTIDSGSVNMERDFESSADLFSTIFTVNSDAIPKSEVLLLGRVVLFMNLLRSSSTLKDEMVHAIAKKLDMLMNALMHEDVYSSILSLHTPVLCASGPEPGLTWQPLFYSILHSLKVFLVVASCCRLAWIELESFLFKNLIHPHFLCLDIVRELWSFVIRHTEIDVINHVVERLCILFKGLASAEPVLTPFCTLRKMARSMCCLLTNTTSAAKDQVYLSVTTDEKSYLSSIMLIALLLEGFPLDSLSDNLKLSAIRKIVTAFYGFMESNSKGLRLNGSLGSSDFIGLPVHALSSLMHSCEIKSSEIIDNKDISQILKFAISLVHGVGDAAAEFKDHYAKVLSAVLDVISTSKQSYISDEMKGLILELQTLFMATSDSDNVLYQCKPSLVSFMVSFSHLEIADGEGSELYSAILSLYHVLLRERHWAFNHLAVGAFANFAACTSCSQLWRFIPDDAALSLVESLS